jgi:hypothetical protein
MYVSSYRSANEADAADRLANRGSDPTGSGAPDRTLVLGRTCSVVSPATGSSGRNRTQGVGPVLRIPDGVDEAAATRLAELKSRGKSQAERCTPPLLRKGAMERVGQRRPAESWDLSTTRSSGCSLGPVRPPKAPLSAGLSRREVVRWAGMLSKKPGRAGGPGLAAAFRLHAGAAGVHPVPGETGVE